MSPKQKSTRTPADLESECRALASKCNQLQAQLDAALAREGDLRGEVAALERRIAELTRSIGAPKAEQTASQRIYVLMRPVDQGGAGMSYAEAAARIATDDYRAMRDAGRSVLLGGPGR